MGPGLTALTWPPRGSSSRANVLAIDRSARRFACRVDAVHWLSLDVRHRRREDDAAALGHERRQSLEGEVRASHVDGEDLVVDVP